MKLMSKHGKPMLTDLPAWLFICGNDDAYLQVEAFSQTPSLVEKFKLYQPEYIPALFERLEGYSTKSKLATSIVRLLFLINNEMEHPPVVKKQNQAPQHVVYKKPRKYNELQYSMYPIELRMEFYIRILDLFCERGDSMFELFAGTKLMVARMVSVASALSSARAKPSYAVLVSVGLARPELNLYMTSTTIFFRVSILYAQQSLPRVNLTLLRIALSYADVAIEVLCNFGRRGRRKF